MADQAIPPKFELVQFHGDTLLAEREPDGTVYVAINPICQSLEISVRTQRKRIETDLILSEGRVQRTLPPALGSQEIVLLRLDLVSGWLFGIDARRVGEGSRDKVLRYQRECYAVLYQHFHPGTAHDVAGKAIPENEMALPITVRKALVDTVRHCFGERAACSLYIKLGLPTTPEFFRQGELQL